MSPTETISPQRRAADERRRLKKTLERAARRLNKGDKRAAAILGRVGGLATSPQKSEAARQNGRRAYPPSEHGTVNRYARHRCRCPLCRAAKSDYMKEIKRRKKGR